MSEPQIIRTPAGEELVVLPRAEYQALVDALAEMEALEDAADVAAYDEAMSDLTNGRDFLLPAEVSVLILQGNGFLRSLRLWRGLSLEQLAERAGIEPDRMTVLELSRGQPDTDLGHSLATALDVPPNWLVN